MIEKAAMPKFEVTVLQYMVTKHSVDADSEDDLQELVGELGSDGLAKCRTETVERKWEIQGSVEVTT